MKKTISYILLTAILALQLSGCSQGNGQGENADSGSVPDASAVLEFSGQDNSLDAYSYAVNSPLRVENPENAIEGGGRKVFLGASRAWYFKKHLFETAEECWDELSYVTAGGKTGSESFDRNHQLWAVGPVAGTDHYVSFDYEVLEGEADCRYFLTERDENQEVLREFSLDFLSGSGSSGTEVSLSISDLAVDCSGAAHLVRQTEGGQQYLLISPEGEILAQYYPEDGDIGGLASLYDGRVAFWVTKREDGGPGVQMSLQYMDGESGRPVVLSALDQDLYYITLFDEKTLLYADREGVYRSGLSGKKPELLYCWMNHGITVDRVLAMQADEEGQIALLYGDSEDYHYLCLKPTTEKVEICEITLAVSHLKKEIYQRLAVEFNKQYPGCHIELKDDYDETALLTELLAGKGPVLIDTYLTGFEEQEELWEPLDTVLEQMGITEELQPSALELGKVNGTLYGIVTDFRLRTLVTGKPDLKDWDYDTFLQCVEDSPDLEAIFDLLGGGDYGTYFITSYLSHGINDTYLLDAETGTMHFDSTGFRKALELGKKYCVREERVNPGSSMLEGKVLCNELTISKPEHLALYRICYGENPNYIGYPTKDGGAHFIESGGSPLAIRRTATKEEKAAAAAFIGLCLSYEGQIQAAKDINFALSIRKDVMEEQIAAMNENTEVSAWGFDQIMLGDDLNVELDRKTLLDMIDQARPRRYFPVALREILFGELEQYFSGAITEDMVISNLESRVGLYLGERH